MDVGMHTHEVRTWHYDEITAVMLTKAEKQVLEQRTATCKEFFGEALLTIGATLRRSHSLSVAWISAQGEVGMPGLLMIVCFA